MEEAARVDGASYVAHLLADLSAQLWASFGCGHHLFIHQPLE